jgi:hypothetical protein
MKIYYMIGMPGTGKTTLMNAIRTNISKSWEKERVVDLLDTERSGNIRILGKYDGEGVYAGTDRLSMAVAPKAIEWIKTKPDEIIIGEGDRLNSREFFRTCGDDLTIIHLTVSDKTREKRYKERGSNQSDKFIQTTKTKCKNVVDEFGPKMTLFGEELGIIKTFNHETEEDTNTVLEWITNDFLKKS